MAKRNFLHDLFGIKRVHVWLGGSHAIAFVRDHQSVSLLAILAIVNFLLYAPALTSYFISDDFATVVFLLFNNVIARGQDLQWFLLQSNDGGLYFRPIGQLFYLLDSLMWGVEPFGYHLTNVIFHILDSFLVFLLAWRLSENRAVGFITMVLFAVMSVHSEAVAWIGARYDVICAFFYLSSVLFFVLYRQRRMARFYFLSIAMFILALASKEIAVTLPLVVLAFDLFHSPSNLSQLTNFFARQMGFWLTLALVLVARLLAFGRVGYGIGINQGWVVYWLDRFLPKLANPLALDGESLRLPILVLTMLMLLLYHGRRQVMLGIAWILLVFIATFNSGASDRSFYIPSFGLAFTLATIFAGPLPRGQPLSRAISLIAIATLLIVYSVALVTRNQQYQLAGEVAQAIPDQVKASHPTLSKDTRLYFVGVPNELQSGVLIYITGLAPSFQLTFRNPTLQVFTVSKLPVLSDGLDNVLFFEVDHRRVRERSDLVGALKERNQCASPSRPILEWNFAADSQGWEEWNDLAPLQVHDGLLMTKSLGNDPYMGSPPVEIPAIDLGKITVTMRVRSDRPQSRGVIFWLASGQDDYSPDLQATFSVQADGDLHTYTADISKSGKLFFGDKILRFRFDPIDAPADIAIKSIAIFAQCAR